MTDPLAAPKLSAAARRRAIDVVRETLARELGGAPRSRRGADTPVVPELAEPHGAFVTLRRRDGELRGCIGTAAAARPLEENLRDLAVSAATRDRRFEPIGADELDDLRIEVSVLSALAPADPSRVEIGRHGLIVRRPGASGLLLPQVASERGWDRETFLAETCRKAGLPADAWRDPGTTLLWFTCDVVHEDEAP